MVCAGVISIENMTEFDTPLMLVCDRIPKEIFKKVYKMYLPHEGSKKLSANMLC